MLRIGTMTAVAEAWGAWRTPIEISVLLCGGWLAAVLLAEWAGAVV